MFAFVTFTLALVDAKLFKLSGEQLRADVETLTGGAWFCSGEKSKEAW